MKKHLEYQDEKSTKFWEIEIKGTIITTSYGKIGATGKKSSKDLGTEEKAQKEFDKLVKSKTKKGYKEPEAEEVIELISEPAKNTIEKADVIVSLENNSSWKKLTSYPDCKVVKSRLRVWKIENGIVWNTFNKIKTADPESFEIHENHDSIARDKNFIYYGNEKFSKIDRDTFEQLEGGYWKDKNYVYGEFSSSARHYIGPLKGLDVENFKYLGNYYALDQSFAYYKGKAITKCVDPKKLNIMEENTHFSMDSEYVFYKGLVIKNVDLKNFEVLNGEFSRDLKSVFYKNKKLARVDIKTWEHIHDVYSKDKNKVYIKDETQIDETPSKWNKAKVIRTIEKLIDRIPHEQIRKEISAWSFYSRQFKILDELNSDKDIKMKKNTLVLGDVVVQGNISVENKAFLIICGTLKATNFLTNYYCTSYINNFQISGLFHVAEQDAVTMCYADSKAKYIVSGSDNSAGSLTMIGGHLKAEIIDNYVQCKNGASIDYKGNNFKQTQFPNYISEEQWEEWGDENKDFLIEKAALIGLKNINQHSASKIFDLGYKTIKKDLNVYKAIDKFLGKTD